MPRSYAQAAAWLRLKLKAELHTCVQPLAGAHLGTSRLKQRHGARLWRSPAAARSKGPALLNELSVRVVCCSCGWAPPQPHSGGGFKMHSARSDSLTVACRPAMLKVNRH